ncbi:hypothetical protein EJD97_014406 [Solanum chilense]|uniref:MADS-box domain-containing protein n=1 Tax=Solanum chilense TaxID=4083 RepID=A0A6N2BDY4_SOLCI|nr:hypothetical protein EJD97_014406 [Solanum chilense]
MGRRKVEIKRIQDKNCRQVAFCKRRKGLLKKAKEISVLCDVDVAVVIISNRGRLHEFSSNNRTSTPCWLDKISPMHQVELITLGSSNLGGTMSALLQVTRRALPTF